MARKPQPRELTICCRANVMLLELRSKGDPMRTPMPYGPASGRVHARDEALLCCGTCGREWTRPSRLERQPAGNWAVEF